MNDERSGTGLWRQEESLTHIRFYGKIEMSDFVHARRQRMVIATLPSLACSISLARPSGRHGTVQRVSLHLADAQNFVDQDDLLQKANDDVIFVRALPVTPSSPHFARVFGKS
jgi:hypothetical protein